MMAEYLNGSTVNVTIDRQPRRYIGAYVTNDFLKILGVKPIKGRDFTADDNKPGAEKVAILGYGLWQRDFGGDEHIVGRARSHQRQARDDRRRHGAGLRVPENEELWVPLCSEFPPRPRGDPQEITPAVLGLLKPGVSPDQATLEFTGIARRFAAAYPDTNKDFNAGQVQPLIQAFTPAPLRGTLWTMLAFCVGRAADRVHERDEHAVRARDDAHQGAGDPIVARRIAPAPGPPDADRKPARRRVRRHRRRAARLPGDRMADADDPRTRNAAAELDHVRYRFPGAPRHDRRDVHGGADFRHAAGAHVIARQRQRRSCATAAADRPAGRSA